MSAIQSISAFIAQIDRYGWRQRETGRKKERLRLRARKRGERLRGREI